ncbi:MULTISPECIES: hypothetical protein [Sphingobacterium]|uniref:Uncharacterized protein n=1 Tax=Sphingobacterium kitahiroshimense TaxID=470446 RepID=A0ABV0BYN1_9SPHI|nr:MULTISPECIES: hypothetical protein [unclassified Sphingobacterium]MBB2953625.1 hypothetical protein [Sphingobacterium sp. JUb56]MCS3554811.1 hypothetical protein [Sphingobacterium sp. JUb21]NJI73683.1 hypothetical protein [Sphingobacterium sp. B16(2022)]TCR05792.1 hypothetical protein EDF66_106261 [Sphingobacterium sp. JUb20]
MSKKKIANEDELQNSNADQLAYDPDKQSFSLDVEDSDPDYDHPSDYDTVAEGAADDDSTYDNSNPYVGDEYADLDELIEDDLEEGGMRIEGEVKLKPIDKKLAETPEDLRDDLDEEGYPINYD